jgi:hypothetical protein
MKAQSTKLAAISMFDFVSETPALVVVDPAFLYVHDPETEISALPVGGNGIGWPLQGRACSIPAVGVPPVDTPVQLPEASHWHGAKTLSKVMVQVISVTTKLR